MKQPEEFDSPESACEHFLWSEKRYVEVDLRTCWDTQKRLSAHIKVRRPIISATEIEKLFANFYSIYKGHVQLLDDLMALRLEGKDYFVEKLGVIMIQFIPFFRMYTDYITRKGERQDALDKLPKKTKKFKEFCEVEKAVTGVKLKKMLKAPLERLPQYLRFMAQVYKTYENKDSQDCQAALDILECAQKISEVTDAMASKAKDAKARRQVGLIQNSMFQNKIKLAVPSRFVVKHEDLAMCVVRSIVTASLVLFNDILILAMAPAGFMGRCKLEKAWPLSGLKVSTKVEDPETDSHRYRFSVTRRKPDGEINVMILICKAEEQLDVWVSKISEWIDRAEHSRRPVNPIQLMRRLRGQRTKGTGSLDTIQITDPQRLREIEAWEEAQRAAKKARKDRRHSHANKSSTPPDQKKLSSASERRNAVSKGRGPPPGMVGKKPSIRAAPRRPYAPPGGKKAPKGGPPPISHHHSPLKHNAPKAPPRPPGFNPGGPPSQNKKPKGPAFLSDIGKKRNLKKAAQSERKSGSGRPGRMGLFAQIQAGKNLKKVKPRAKKKVVSKVGDLESNIARYRKYVCDSSEEETKSDSSDDEWDQV